MAVRAGDVARFRSRIVSGVMRIENILIAGHRPHPSPDASSNRYLAVLALHMLRCRYGDSPAPNRLASAGNDYAFIFGIYIFVLENFAQRRSNILWPLPVLMILWANWHSGMLFGIFLVAYYTIFEYLGRGKQDSSMEFPRWQRLALVLIVCVIGALINPNTLDAVMYPFQLGKLYSESILKANSVIELQSLTFGRIPAFWFSVVLTGHRRDLIPRALLTGDIDSFLF